MDLSLNYKGTVYGFTRDLSGAGFWYCIRGAVPGVLGKSTSGLMVPTILSTELSNEAVRQGLASYQDLSRQIRKEKKVKVKAVRVTSNSKKAPTLLKGVFNPFSLENSVKSDAEIEVEQVLKRLTTISTRKRVTDEEETTEFFADLFSPDEDDEVDPDANDIDELEFEEVEEEGVNIS